MQVLFYLSYVMLGCFVTDANHGHGPVLKALFAVKTLKTLVLS